MIVLKILAAPFVVALTLLVAIVSFLYCVASALCQIGCVVLTLLALVLFIGGQTPVSYTHLQIPNRLLASQGQNDNRCNRVLAA